MGAIRKPHGGVLRDLYLGTEAAKARRQQAIDLPSWDLNDWQLCDLELLLNGAFSPLDGFLGRADYERVLGEMRLSSGLLWPIPVTLDVMAKFAEEVAEGDTIALRDPEGVLIATMGVEEIWTPDRAAEAASVFGTTDEAHPGGRALLQGSSKVYLGGKVEGVEPPTHYDFKPLRRSPSELRERFQKQGWGRVLAVQTEEPVHCAEHAALARAAAEHATHLLIHPVVGLAQPGDVPHYARIRCLEHLVARSAANSTMVSLLNLAARMAGPREALWHAIIEKNHGCSHFLVRSDHAGAGERPDGRPWYEPLAAQDLCARHEAELDIRMVPLQKLVYVESRDSYVPVGEVTPEMRTPTLSGGEFQRRLRDGLVIPGWFAHPEIVEELRALHPPQHERGFTVFFTGLSGSGKSTIARALMASLLEIGGRPVTLLDGDLVRKHLSSGLGFSKEHRDLNIRRIGFVAAEITKNGGIAICAPIAPYAATRRVVREMIEAVGGFLEVHVATVLEVCEARDRKGLYAKARAGLIREFTGISDPYDEPEKPEVRIDTQSQSPEHAAQSILERIKALGFIG